MRHYGKDHEVGDLFKVTGARWDEGPFGFGDESPLAAHCGYSVDERYAFTYERQTHEDTRPGSGDVRALVEELHAARAEGLPALRAFFERRFDVARLTDYMVVRNWLSAWDDVWQNHYLYRRADGKFMVLPTDMDNHFGFAGPSAFDGSFFSGVVNGRSNYRDLPNYLKDSFLRAYRAEFLARVEELVPVRPAPRQRHRPDRRGSGRIRPGRSQGGARRDHAVGRMRSGGPGHRRQPDEELRPATPRAGPRPAVRLAGPGPSCSGAGSASPGSSP